MTTDTYFCGAAARARHEELSDESEWIDTTIHSGSVHPVHHWFCRAEGQIHRRIAEVWIHAEATPYAPRETVEERFTRLADKWSRDTAHISSVTTLINDSSYQQIIGMGMEVVPYLLGDLDRNKRFWFPALASITGLRPFDRKDSGNYRLMTEAWLRWGRRRELI